MQQTLRKPIMAALQALSNPLILRLIFNFLSSEHSTYLTQKRENLLATNLFPYILVYLTWSKDTVSFL